jgi:hypothetical protein
MGVSTPNTRLQLEKLRVNLMMHSKFVLMFVSPSPIISKYWTYALREPLYAVHGLIVVDGQAIAMNVGSLTSQPEAFILCLPTFWNLHYLTPISVDYYTSIAISHRVLSHITQMSNCNISVICASINTTTCFTSWWMKSQGLPLTYISWVMA